MVENNPKVSVCIPNYNGSQYIENAIQSVLNQSYTNFELIIVDNCSTDNSIEVINKFSDPRIKIYRNPTNIGMVKNWNKCISLASGEYLCLLSHDDVLEKDMLMKESKVLDLNPNVGFVFSLVKFINSKGEILNRSTLFFNTQHISIMKGETFFKKNVCENMVFMPSVMVRKECYRTLGNFDETTSYTCDWEMWLRISLHYDVAFIPEPLAYYRSHPTSLTNVVINSDGFLWPMAEYNTLKKVFSIIPPDKKYLFSLKSKSMNNLAKRSVALSIFYLANKKPGMSRRVIAIAFAIDKSIILYYKTWVILFLSCVGSHLGANILSFLRKVKRYLKRVKRYSLIC